MNLADRPATRFAALVEAHCARTGEAKSTLAARIWPERLPITAARRLHLMVKRADDGGYPWPEPDDAIRVLAAICPDVDAGILFAAEDPPWMC